MQGFILTGTSNCFLFVLPDLRSSSIGGSYSSFSSMTLAVFCLKATIICAGLSADGQAGKKIDNRGESGWGHSSTATGMCIKGGTYYIWDMSSGDDGDRLQQASECGMSGRRSGRLLCSSAALHSYCDGWKVSSGICRTMTVKIHLPTVVGIVQNQHTKCVH